MYNHFLKINNIIRDSYNNVFKIHSHSSDGIFIHKHSDFPIENPKLILVKYGIDEDGIVSEGLIDSIQKTKYLIDGCPFEGEKDLAILKMEVEQIKTQIKISELTEDEKNLQERINKLEEKLVNELTAIENQKYNSDKELIAAKTRIKNLKQNHKEAIENHKKTVEAMESMVMSGKK